MRKQNQEITDQKIIEQILSDAVFCRVAMIDGEIPYLLPFNYGYQNGVLYIHSATEGKKLNILEKQPMVCFEVENKAEVIRHEKACKWSTLYRSVIGYGNAEIIRGAQEKIQALDVIMKQHGSKGRLEISNNEVGGIVIIKITITSLSGKKSGNWETLVEASKLTINSNRLVLREITWNDVEDIHKLHSFPEVDEFNTVGLPTNVDETREYLRTMIEEQDDLPRKAYTWTVRFKETDNFIGIAGLILSADKFRLGEIFYKLLPTQWGKGYATEVAKVLIKTGFEKFKLHKVEAGVATGNLKSIRVLEKSGMTREGLRRKILPIRGRWVDSYHYAIVEDE